METGAVSTSSCTLSFFRQAASGAGRRSRFLYGRIELTLVGQRRAVIGEAAIACVADAERAVAVEGLACQGDGAGTVHDRQPDAVGRQVAPQSLGRLVARL